MKLSRPVKAWAHWNTVSKGWWAWHGNKDWANDPCYIVPAALWRKAQAALKAKGIGKS